MICMICMICMVCMVCTIVECLYGVSFTLSPVTLGDLREKMRAYPRRVRFPQTCTWYRYQGYHGTYYFVLFCFFFQYWWLCTISYGCVWLFNECLVNFVIGFSARLSIAVQEKTRVYPFKLYDFVRPRSILCFFLWHLHDWCTGMILCGVRVCFRMFMVRFVCMLSTNFAWFFQDFVWF